MRESSLVGRPLICAAFVSLAAAAAACGSAHVDAGVTTPPPPTANASLGVNASGGGVGVNANVGANATGGGTNPQPSNTTPTPPPTTTATAPVGGPATPVSASMNAAAGPAIDAMAKTDARGMQPEGQAFAGQFTEGQVLEQTFQAVPGKCYAAFAVGAGTITQLDLSAMTVSPSPAIPSMQLATSSSTGSTATIGGGGNCVKYSLPIGGPFKLVIRATHGSGIAVGRLYSK